MLLHLVLIAAGFWSSQARPAEAPQPAKSAAPKQLVYVPERQQQYSPERQQYSPEIQYDLSLLGPQFQVPTYNFIDDKQAFPRVQPQIILYHGGGPGQPFLLQPGSPPGNFLVPQVPQIPQQPGPNILRHTPQRPVFVAGYPKPAHIPPIEKDAEEVPTNPSKIPPFNAKEKPEKLETFNEDITPKKTATEAEVLAAADRNPAFNSRPDLKPGQRFFILNGQPLFTNYPYGSQLYPNINLKYAQPAFLPQPQPSLEKNISPYQNLLFRSNLDDVPSPRIGGGNLPQSYPENLVLLNQPGFQDFLFKPSANLAQTKEGNKQKGEFRIDAGGLGLDDPENDAVILDARQQDAGSNSDSDSEVISAAEKPGEPTISQAQPGAIALAGPGGVAAAAPRGTAFVGKEGIAVSSPQATAIAGPTRDEIQQSETQPQKTKKQTNKRKQ